eukprot:TRINITY_DN8950_c0_g1_i1.p1 TRINITY_DN8950_c0_g1~~TRINITY_DN8950_c0_g1_i1.p1  ORF type:complete len:683 (+),score=108.21 TRINITY_DN8950_c0_g1_i1:111-2159(+)
MKNGDAETDPLLRPRRRSSKGEPQYAFHSVGGKKQERTGLNEPIGGRKPTPHTNHTDKKDGDMFRPPSSAVDTLRIDLKKVAYKLSIPLSALLKHFQSDHSSETCIRNDKNGQKLRLEVPIGGDGGEVYQDPIEGSPLPSPSLDPSCVPRKNLNDSRDFGTTVVIAHRGCESPNLASDDASISASMCSDEALRIEVIGQKTDEKKPHIAYLIQDSIRGATVMAIPNLPPNHKDETEGSSFFSRWCFNTSQHHESTSDAGDISCMDLAMIWVGKTTVIKSLMIYVEEGSLYLQVQRRMPMWGIPCLLLGIICSALVPPILQKLRDADLSDGAVGGSAARTWWAATEFGVSTILMIIYFIVNGCSRRVFSFDKLYSTSSAFILSMIVLDVVRHISWSYLILQPSEGPNQVLHSCHPLYMVLIRIALFRVVLVGELGGVALALVGLGVASFNMNGWSNWAVDDGILSSSIYGVATALYLTVAQYAITSQPIIGLVWVCKVVSFLCAIIATNIEEDTSIWSYPFLGGDNGLQYSLALGGIGVGRDIFYLCALAALYAMPVSTSMTCDAVLAFIFTHWLFKSESHSVFHSNQAIPGLVSCIVGMIITSYVCLREKQYSEVDLTSPDLTRKTARPPPKLTSAALRHQQRLARSDPPIVWEYSNPPTNLTASADPRDLVHDDQQPGSPH